MVPFPVSDKEDEEEKALAVNHLGLWNFREFGEIFGNLGVFGEIWKDLAEFGSVSGVGSGRRGISN